MKLLIKIMLVLLCSLPLVAWAQEERFSVNLKDVELAEFIDSVGRITDRTFMLDPRVRGRVSIRSQRQLTADEVYQVFLSQLRVNGFAVVEMDDDRLKIVPEQTARLEPIRVEGAEAPNTDGQDIMATRVLEVRHSSAAQLVNILTPLMDRRIGVITHYEPSNLLILTDWGTNLERLTNLVRRIDTASSDDLEMLVLEHAAASEMEQLLNQLLRREGRGGQAPTIISDNRLNVLLVRGDSATRNEVRRLISELDQPVERSANTQVFYLRHASATEMVSLLQNLAEDEQAAGEGSERRRLNIQAHESTNALVISGSPYQLREMRLIIDQLDIRRAQVLVEAIIVEISERQARELGVSWLFGDTSGGAVPVASGNFGGGLGGVAEGYSSGGDAGALAALAGIQGLAAGVGRISSSGISFAAILRALETETDSNILSTPSLLTLDNAEASILVGQEVPFITGNQLDTNNNPFQTIQRREVGVRLQIKPQINDGDSVRLEIMQEVSNVEDSVQGAADLITNKREINTTVMADNDDIIVLGGLIQDEQQEIVRKVPLLGDIPWLGALFRSTSVSTEKRNLMVFIKPQILHDRDALALASSDKYRYMRAAHLLRSESSRRLDEWEPRTAANQNLTLEDLFPARWENR
ncbi:general secretion pathway protein D [Marinospirillum celere]|uniref:General secretion pathway protein D n=1 Tax=Marinospirillum celere TaxID=1122252 RepID=A0A1I1G9N2_9GAMM|nr:type II secretion system secretin GspD [Marinospirillum celere]SFC05860.1 general secretion pathway protein D [Marinospirillum celere]